MSEVNFAEQELIPLPLSSASTYILISPGAITDFLLSLTLFNTGKSSSADELSVALTFTTYSLSNKNL